MSGLTIECTLKPISMWLCLFEVCAVCLLGGEHNLPVEVWGVLYLFALSIPLIGLVVLAGRFLDAESERLN